MLLGEVEAALLQLYILPCIVAFIRLQRALITLSDLAALRGLIDIDAWAQILLHLLLNLLLLLNLSWLSIGWRSKRMCELSLLYLRFLLRHVVGTDRGRHWGLNILDCVLHTLVA